MSTKSGKSESKKKPKWLWPVPKEVETERVAVSFKLSPEDVGKSANSVFNIEDGTMFIYEISKNSFFNGLIMGDRIASVNGVTGKDKCLAELMKGEQCNVEVIRRKGVVPATVDRFRKAGITMKPGHNLFIVTMERGENNRAVSLGLKMTVLRDRCFIIEVCADLKETGEDYGTNGSSSMTWRKSTPGGILSKLLGPGDVIIDIDGEVIHKIPNPETSLRDRMSKLSLGVKLTALVERPIVIEVAKDWERFINSVAPPGDNKVPEDAAKIGREASTMHFLILKKLTTPSRLTIDAKRRSKTNDKTSEAAESNISISTASTEMQIKSDVEDMDELKRVTTKSHAAGNSDSGAFAGE